MAEQLGLSALALSDDDGLYGVVKAHLFARHSRVKLVLASTLTLLDAPRVVVYVENAEGYANLCRLLSKSRLAHPKGEAGLPWREVAERSRGLIALLPNPAAKGAVAP